MSLSHALSVFLTLNLLLAAGYLALRLIARPLDARAALRLHYRALGAVLLLTLAQVIWPGRPVFEPAAKIWSAPSLRAHVSAPITEAPGYLALPAATRAPAVPAASFSAGALAVLGLLFALGLGRLIYDLRALQRIRRGAYVLRRQGRVVLLAHERVGVPFSYWLPGAAAVVVPSALLGKSPDLRISITHELQHHRQRDTLWVYAIWALRTLCFLNPFIHLWARRLGELQEFACDETLVGHRKVESGQYARCLIEAAETALRQGHRPARATASMSLVGRKLLRKRIEKMMSQSKWKSGWSAAALTTIALGLVLGATAYATQGLVQDRRVSMNEAREMAERANRGTSFPIVVNDLVLRQLNRYLGTPEGREFIRQSLRRREAHRATIDAAIARNRLPEELAAIPIVESGYRVLEQKPKLGWGAGLWMFIKSTARSYGLRVDAQVDERLHVVKSTDAAMRMLKTEHQELQDWQLTLLSYNVGIGRVKEAIDVIGTRDAWELVRAGIENDADYLAKVMAAVLILKNPDAAR